MYVKVSIKEQRIIGTPEAGSQKCSVKKSLLRNFAKIHRKTPAPRSFFNKIAGLKPVALLKRDSGTGLFL